MAWSREASMAGARASALARAGKSKGSGKFRNETTHSVAKFNLKHAVLTPKMRKKFQNILKRKPKTIVSRISIKQKAKKNLKQRMDRQNFKQDMYQKPSNVG